VEPIHVHYTLRHGSWLNLAEIEIGVRARQSLGRRRMIHLAILHHETRA
jgi:hypothetical protein